MVITGMRLLKVAKTANIKMLCSAQSCLTLCDPLDCSPPGSSVHGIFQARIQEWILLQGIFLTQGLDSCVSCIGRQILYHCITWEAYLIL